MNDLQPGQVLTGPLFDEPVRVETDQDRVITSLVLAKRTDILPGLK